MNTEKIKEVFSNESFVKELFALETAAEVRSALKEKGVEMTEEEILAIRDLLVKVEKGEITTEQLERAQHGELPEELLEQIAGGVDVAEYVVTGLGSLLSLPLSVATYVTLAVDDKW